MDRENLRDETRRLIGDTDTDTTRRRWTDTNIDERLDIAMEEICAKTACIKARGTDINIVSGTQEYDVPTGFLYATIVTWLNSDSAHIRLDPVTETELDLYDPNWRDSDSSGDTPTHYYVRINKIGIYPIPNFSTTSGLRVNFIKRPTAFATDASIPYDALSHLYPFHRLIAILAAMWCSEDDDKHQKVASLQNKYHIGLREMKMEIEEREIGESHRIINIYETVRKGPRRTR